MHHGNRTKLTSLLLPAAALLGLVLLFFNRMAFSNLILARGDTFLYFYPYWHAAAEALRELRVPFWNPSIFMGAPLLANSQVGFFYPLNWPLWFFLKTPYAASASIILHIFIAAAGAYFLARRQLLLGRSGALVAAISFALGGYLTAQVEHINQLQGLAWLPWFFVAVELARLGTRRAWLRSVLATAVLFALQLLAGHTQTTFITGVAVLIWLAASWPGRRFLNIDVPSVAVEINSSLFQPFSALITGAVLAAALAAMQLLPTLELMDHSSRAGGLPVNEVLSFSLPPHLLAQALLPAYGQSLFTEYVAFVPLVIIILAFIGGWQWRKRAGVLQALALTISGFFLALGAYNPFYWLLARLPGFSFFRAPARWLVLYALGLSLLAGVGWHLLWRWAGEEGSRQDRQSFLRSNLLPPLLSALVVLLVLAIWGFAAGFLVDILPLGSEAPFVRPSLLTLGGWFTELLLSVVLLATAGFAGSVPIRRAALSGLLIVGLMAGFFASRTLPYNNLTTPEAYFDLRPSTSRILAEESQEPPDRLLSLSDIFFDPGDQAEIDSIYAGQLSEQARFDYTVAIKQKEINAPNLPMIYNLASIDGFDGGILPLRDYGSLISATITGGQETMDGRLRELLDAIPEPRWLDLFNARFLITDKTGDLWIDGIYYDRQHPITLHKGEGVPVTYLPEFEATEIRLLATGKPAAVTIDTREGGTLSLQPELVEEMLYRMVLPEPSIISKLEIASCELTACTLQAISLVDTEVGAFYPLVPGDYRLIHSGDVKIYENSNVLPRAFIAGNWFWAADVSESLGPMRDPDFDVRTTAVIVGDPATNDDIIPGGTGIAKITSYRPEEVVVETESATGGLLVLTDAIYPGWRATVDGQPATMYQTDGLFRGLFVPQGEHQVIFEYESTSYRLGLIVFIFAITIIGMVLIAMALEIRSKR
ncbi:MAG: YfhO family protein [Candidatus Promineifilaceae bacterium]